MNKELYQVKNKWLKSILVTLLSSAAIEILVVLFGTLLTKDIAGFVPWTFHFLWDIVALVGAVYLVKMCNVKFDSFFWPLLCFSSLFSVFIFSLTPEKLKIEGNYCGVESIFLGNEYASEYPRSLSFLYRIDDPEINREFVEAKKVNEYVGERCFLFWQSGLAYGFNPIGIRGYNGGDDFLDRIELVFTVGPIVVIESFIRGLVSIFPILMVIQIIWFIFRKKYLLWDERISTESEE